MHCGRAITAHGVKEKLKDFRCTSGRRGTANLAVEVNVAAFSELSFAVCYE